MIRTIYIYLENIVELQVELCFFSSTMIGTIHDSSNIVQLYRTIVLLYRNYDSSYTPVLHLHHQIGFTSPGRLRPIYWVTTVS